MHIVVNRITKLKLINNIYIQTKLGVTAEITSTFSQTIRLDSLVFIV